MAIHAKANGLLISGKLVGENDEYWIFQAMDNKRPTVIGKDEQKSKVFSGERAVHDAMEWQDSLRKK